MTSDKVFIIKDADTDVAASVTHHDDAPASVTIMSVDRDQFITMSVADFARMAAAIDRAVN